MLRITNFYISYLYLINGIMSYLPVTSLRMGKFSTTLQNKNERIKI